MRPQVFEKLFYYFGDRVCVFFAVGMTCGVFFWLVYVLVVGLSLCLPVWSGGFDNAVVRVSRTVSTRRVLVAMVMSDEVTRDFDE